ncbi:hypothetical protein IV203_035816 [Nitzschia inconspicua]|uniref:Uncharacterized protein n=1 Tax=Nitzschia inconspicua TaxID=303405 RepID=A0A9K3PV05_9STRA|nr:hypothetical protein IV203_035816 [Nitzschia inconspicua]
MTSRNGSSSEVESWRKSKAKAFVKELLENDEMCMDMPEAQLYRLYPQHFGQYSQNQFICNVKSLKKTIREDREANALQEAVTAALLHDRALFPKTTTFWGYDRWEGSALISNRNSHVRDLQGTENPTAKVYSHKSHGPAVAYELGISIFENGLVWINGPFDASVHDITMFRNPDDPENRLKVKIPEGKKAIADKGYLGEQHTKIAPPSQYDSRELAEFKNRARARTRTSMLA